MAEDISRKNTIKKLQPQERLKQLINYSNQVEVDFHLSPLKLVPVLLYSY